MSRSGIPILVVLVVALAAWFAYSGLNRPVEQPVEVSTPARQPVENLTGELVVFHAGSLSVPFAEISKAFEAKHPGVKVLAEAAGSRDTARKVSDLKRPCDVLGSADAEVIDELLIPDFADYNIMFARNEIVIAYTEKAGDAATITPDNWHEILLKKEIAFGRADPDRDPCGYRTVMVFQLAQKHYGIDGLSKALIDKHGLKYMRPKETDLLALLESGEIDYLFIYYSVAAQHNLKYVKLPDEINLGRPALADAYSSASVQVTGKNPGEFTTMKGSPIVYGVTIPKGAPNPKAAEAWVAFLLSPEGAEILDATGQPPISPAESKQLDLLPEKLKASCVEAG